jgi:membrane associated rhomboid family serine protease
MAVAQCGCGGALEIGDEAFGRALSCPFCQRIVRPVGRASAGRGFNARLTIAAGPDRVGEQFLLGGGDAIGIGKLVTTPIRLDTPLISRLHCELTRTPDGGWQITDRNSANGLFVNQMRVAARTLQNGDMIRVGEYELRFDRAAAADDEVEEVAVEEGQAEPGYGLGEAPTIRTMVPTAPPPVCPKCHRKLMLGAKICVDCGIDIATGRTLTTSSEVEDETTIEQAEAWVQQVSLGLPVGVFPIMSADAPGARRANPYVTWMIVVVTTLASAVLYVYLRGNDHPDPRALNLMLWIGNREVTDKKATTLRQTLERHYRQQAMRDSPTGTIGAESERQVVLRSEAEAADLLGAPQGARFRWHQPLTHTLLDERVVHLAFCLVFLLIFGLRINEVIGNAWMLLLYPLLGAAAGLIDWFAFRHEPLSPSLGAAGAITGLAGLYLVFFPARRIYLASWARAGSRLGIRLFGMRSFWLVIAWLFVSELLPMFFAEERVAHLANLGALALGIAIGIGLIVTRQAHCGGGDIVSLALGKPFAPAPPQRALPV